jgi:hypothetical protein
VKNIRLEEHSFSRVADLTLRQEPNLIQTLIDGAKPFDSIELPPHRLTVPNLLISKPISLIGRPGTVLEVTSGSILIDLNQNPQREFSPSSPENRSSFRTPLSKNYQLNEEHRTYMVTIQEVLIEFNRHRVLE